MRRQNKGLLYRELSVFVLAALLIVLFSVPSSRHEALYEGVLAVEGSLASGVWTLPSLGKLPAQMPWVIFRHPGSSVMVLAPLGRILIHCAQGVPDEIIANAEAFDRWVKENCQFSPLWSPTMPSP